MKVKIECSEEEARLISLALDMYCRNAMLQFDYLTDNRTIQKRLWEDETGEKSDLFRKKADELKAIFGYSANSNPGIFNKTFVEDDARIACHIHQQIRHQFYLEDKTPNKPKFTNNAYPADICQIAGIKIPDFKIEINETKND